MVKGVLYSFTALMAVFLAFILGFATLLSPSRDDYVKKNAVEVKIVGGVVPAQYIPWIRKAIKNCDAEYEDQFRLTAPLMAAQLKQESNFKPDVVSSAGAEGLAQFMPGTWKQWGVDANNNGKKSPFEPPDAILAQGRFMCHLLEKAEDEFGGPRQSIDIPTRMALAGYNAGWGAVLEADGIPDFEETQDYVREIMARAEKWTSEDGDLIGNPGSGDVGIAIEWAVQQVGTYYKWGGTCTDPRIPSEIPKSDPTWNSAENNWEYNCDCSSLTQQAYAKAGVQLPRVTGDQINMGKSVSASELKPGDLIFPSSGHVGMFIGNNKVVHAPGTGQTVEVTTASNYWRGGALDIRRVVSKDDTGGNGPGGHLND